MNKTSHVPIAVLSMLAAVTATADDALPKSRAEALAMEAKDALPLTSFYDPPKPLGARTPGALIRAEPFDGYDLPRGRMQYAYSMCRARSMVLRSLPRGPC